MFKLVAIVEKSKIVREGLVSMLRLRETTSQIISIESFDSWATALKGRSSPDLIIVNPDLTKSGIDRLRLKHRIDRHTLFVAIVYLYYSYQEVNAMFDEIIYITDSEDVIRNKLQSLLNRIEGIPTRNLSGQLTSREKSVLRLLLQGLSNKEVADKLYISTHTVISHRKNIIEKTGIRSLSGLAVYAILNNIADMTDLKQ